MSIERILQILDRAHNGPFCTMREWVTRVVPTTVSEKLEKYRLTKTCDKENPINTDDALVDEFFKAGFEMALELGFICEDTERVVRVTEEELKDAINDAPSELPLGKGNDRVVLKNRKPEDKRPPLVSATGGHAVPEDIWVRFHQAIVQNREIDIVAGGSLVTVFGHPVLAGTPYETMVGRRETQMIKEALRKAGRPGMPIIAVTSSTTVFGQLGGLGNPEDFDPDTDIALVMSPTDLTISYTTLNKVVQAINIGAKIRPGMVSMIGGYTRGPEGCVLGQIAGNMLQFAIHQASFIGGSSSDARYAGNSGREAQWAMSVACQAISRNTHLLKTTTLNQVGGSGTEMILYESAVGMMNASSAGLAGIEIPREPEFCSEVAKCSAGMTRKQINEIAKVLIPKYENMLWNPPEGKDFRNLYDLEALEPTKEWFDLHLKVKKELIELGVPLKYP